ncbi:MAG: hypothetical protein E6R03_16330 [Hyphomicrobiaceae bacterium]|nr:MAG: hypothetical protein E6R03_16330 [Hyphomicrobiaceae bacterium]
MKIQKCKVLRAFMLQGKRIDIGVEIELPAAFAAELKSVKKVEYVQEPVKVQDEAKPLHDEKPKAPEVKPVQDSESPKGGKPSVGKGGSR